ncbi:hypothetical protein OSB04_un000293 [Centaurea solstitialis]|uniref:Reverse transcriptase zinc-binding domain-containing protein n=1 Tax=Centaurea solstitialis TaxID=347529 RepID=A0AA38W625_9ASTR|nr:hypothetical protein OSB04_un000293 [Centaurea solstitialis]
MCNRSLTWTPSQGRTTASSDKHFLRFDTWRVSWRALSSQGPLSQIIPYRRFTNEGFHADTSVRELIDNCNGIWPEMWVNLNPIAFSSPIPSVSDNSDVIRWRKATGGGVDFSIKEALRSFSGVPQRLLWTKFVWFKGHIPKLSFCMWVACYGRLPTQDRVGSWLPENHALSCPLCGTCADSHDHLFFTCSYSRQVWRCLKRMVNLHGFPEVWSTILEQLVENRGPRSLSQRLALSGAVYFIWRERNRRLFQHQKQPPIVVFKQIRDLIVAREATWRRGKKT